MLPSRPLSFGVVGGGFSGALTAIHLLRRCRRGDTVLLFERRQSFGRGQAFSTGNPNHVLNVRAGNMSAFPDRPDHFVEWLAGQGLASAGPGSFVSRETYGAYVQSLLAGALWTNETGGNFCVVPDEVVAIVHEPGGLTFTTAGGHTYNLDLAVLATGNLPPDARVGAYMGDPWDPEACRGVPPEAPVLLVGSGLTMVDVVLSLLDAGHEGPIHALSRRGLLPHTHARTPAVAIPRHELPRAGSLVALTRWARRAAREAAARGVGWHGVVDGLRPYLPELWRALPIEAKRRFLRHLRPYWEVHRHRLAPAVAARIEAAIARGQLRVVAGRIVALEPREDEVWVEYRRRGSPEAEAMTVARAINCSGPATNYAACQEPLLRQLLDNGSVRPDPLRLGLEVTEDTALVDVDGRASPRLFAVGPVARGVFWESVAVADIRLHCADLAEHLSDNVAARLRGARAPAAREAVSA